MPSKRFVIGVRLSVLRRKSLRTLTTMFLRALQSLGCAVATLLGRVTGCFLEKSLGLDVHTAPLTAYGLIRSSRLFLPLLLS
jgi:hypothetical protein